MASTQIDRPIISNPGRPAALSPERGERHPENVFVLDAAASAAPGRLLTEGASTPPRLKISRDADGGWLVAGLPNRPRRRFQDLQEGLDWAQHACPSAPTDIEIWIDNFYLFVPKGRGWPRIICSAARPQPAQPETKIADEGRPQLRSWYKARLAPWHKSIFANARDYSGSKAELIFDAVSGLFSHRRSAGLPPGGR